MGRGLFESILGLGVILFGLMLVGCSKYQVVQKIDVNMYHLHNPKLNKVKIIVTEQELEVDKFYRLKSIDYIDFEELHK